MRAKAKQRPPVQNSSAELRHWGMLFLTAVIWGSSFILIKRGLFTADGQELFTPLQVGAMRILFAAMFMLPFIYNRFQTLKNGKFKYLLAVGVFGNGIPAFLFAIAQTEIPSALAGMLNALVPVFSMLIGLAVFGVRIKLLQAIGVLIGLGSAVGLILSTGQIDGSTINISYALLIVAATICYAISLNVIKQYLQEESAVSITGLALVLVSPVGLVILLSTDFISRVDSIDGAWTGVGSISILAILGTAIALMVFNKMVKETSTIFASSVTYLIPLIAIIWGLIDGENLVTSQVACAFTMLGGIFLINRG
ncbi:DMT family transporter [Cryomorphaceae bacterium 1068]|nr:DMT family transporter [Cryomorphaceae bacterium 1068]